MKKRRSSEIKGNLSMLFGTPFISYQWPDSDELNKELAEVILARETVDTGGRGIRSNAGGWQSRGDLFTWSEACIQQLKRRTETMVFNLLGEIVRKDGTERSFTLFSDSWANVSRTNNFRFILEKSTIALKSNFLQ